MFYCVQPEEIEINVTILEFTSKLLCYEPAPVARRLQLAIDISCPQGAQQQTRRPPLLLSTEGTNRRTDGHSTVT